MKKLSKILLGISLFFISTLMVNASTVTYQRTRDNLGVNKKWVIDSYNINNVLRTPLVNASEKIYDFADIFTDLEEKQLYLEAKNFLDNSNMDLVILTTDLAYSDYDLEDYAADFYDYNDFGINLEHYSGILLIINMNSYNRFYNLYAFGNGMLYYDDMRLESMLDNMYDEIAAGYYRSGVSAFIGDALYYYKDGIPNYYKDSYINDNGDFVYVKTFQLPLFEAFIFASIVTIVVMVVLVNKNKMVKKATKAIDYLDRNSINYTKKEDVFLNTHTTSYVISSSSSSGSSGGGSISRGSSGGSHRSGSGRHF